ncbi:hypothetical protein MHU86_2334 [Fragilaria crotonensis]|nr:hypothetical protein MHU86_2334 [Fragilaria crotonensis]
MPEAHRPCSFGRTTPTIPGIIISHAAISKQLGTDGYHMSSFTESIGHIHFPNRLRSSQDIYIILQPTASRGGLTFTEALIAPSPEAHLAPLLRIKSSFGNYARNMHLPLPPRSSIRPTA